MTELFGCIVRINLDGILQICGDGETDYVEARKLAKFSEQENEQWLILLCKYCLYNYLTVSQDMGRNGRVIGGQ